MPKKRISFRTPAELHRTRWIEKSIYSLKINLFKRQFKLSEKETIRIRDICIFTVKFT